MTRPVSCHTVESRPPPSVVGAEKSIMKSVFFPLALVLLFSTRSNGDQFHTAEFHSNRPKKPHQRNVEKDIEVSGRHLKVSAQGKELMSSKTPPFPLRPPRPPPHPEHASMNEKHEANMRDGNLASKACSDMEGFDTFKSEYTKTMLSRKTLPSHRQIQICTAHKAGHFLALGLSTALQHLEQSPLPTRISMQETT